MTRHGVTLLSPRPKVPTRVMGRVDCESSVTQTKRAPKPAEANWHERLERRGLSPPTPRIPVSYRRGGNALRRPAEKQKTRQRRGRREKWKESGRRLAAAGTGQRHGPGDQPRAARPVPAPRP